MSSQTEIGTEGETLTMNPEVDTAIEESTLDRKTNMQQSAASSSYSLVTETNNNQNSEKNKGEEESKDSRKTNMQQSAASLSYSLVTETNNNQNSEKNKGEEESKNCLPFYKLFLFADFIDVLLMIVGTVSALANGLALPLMAVLFGDLVDAFGSTIDTNEVADEVSKVSLRLVCLAVGAGLASLFQVACWIVTGERQVARIRNLYLKTILRQDIAFFDKETNTGVVVGRMSGDTVLIQGAMGEQVGKFIQLISSFIGSFVVALSHGWLLTLVMLSSIPPLAMSGAATAIIVSKMASRGQASYSEAGIIVEETIGSIRTVASFTGEKLAINKYKKSLKSSYESSVKEGLAAGVGLGSVMIIVFYSYAFAIWFGSRMIMNKGCFGGDVINIISHY